MVRISNLELLRVLEENPRASYIEIAKRLGISDTAVRKRMRKLEEDGTIRSYSVDIDPSKLGFRIEAIIGVDSAAESYMSILERLKEDPQVRSLYSSSGDHMIMFSAWFKDSRALHEFLKRLEESGGVTKVCPAMIQERLK